MAAVADSHNLAAGEALLNEESTKLNELIQKVRDEAKLRPIFRAKRPFAAVQSSQSEADTEDSEPKHVKFTIEPKDNTQRNELMMRLSTFSFLFHYIPRPLSALDCAKHGWTDTKKVDEKDQNISILTCQDCNKNMFVIDLDSSKCSLKKAIEVKEKYKEGLYSCHDTSCEWHTSMCKEDSYNFPLITIAEGLERFESEAKNIVSACQIQKSSIPKIDHPEDINITSKVNYFSKRAKESKDISLEDITAAHIISLYGWKSLDPSIPGIRCDLCFSKRAFYQMEQDETLDAIKEHKHYCPWINSEIAGAYTPRGFSARKNDKISGSDWMKQVICLEYGLLIKREDLSASARQSVDDKLYSLKQKMYEAYDLLKTWKSE